MLFVGGGASAEFTGGGARLLAELAEAARTTVDAVGGPGARITVGDSGNGVASASTDGTGGPGETVDASGAIAAGSLERARIETSPATTATPAMTTIASVPARERRPAMTDTVDPSPVRTRPTGGADRTGRVATAGGADAPGRADAAGGGTDEKPAFAPRCEMLPKAPSAAPSSRALAKRQSGS